MVNLKARDIEVVNNTFQLDQEAWPELDRKTLGPVENKRAHMKR